MVWEGQGLALTVMRADEGAWTMVKDQPTAGNICINWGFVDLDIQFRHSDIQDVLNAFTLLWQIHFLQEKF